MTARLRRCAAATALLVAVLAPASARADDMPALRPVATMAAGAQAWADRVHSAASFARGRKGRVSFAVMDPRGHLRGYGMARAYRSASVVKPMLMVSYLSRPDVRDRALRRRDRARLGPMITRSDNRAATEVRDIVGNAALAALARRAGMRSFATAPSWGSSRITPADQVRLFERIDRLVPARHRAYALELLSSIVRSQRWGIPSASPSGWEIYFKGGWRRAPGGRIVHQVALLRHDRERIALAVLTDGNASYRYGKESLAGVASRLLAGLERPPMPRFRPLRSLG